MGLSSAVDLSAVARVTGIKTEFRNLRGGKVVFLPQRIIIVGQGSTSVTYPLTKKQIFSSFEAGSTYGFGSPIHLAALQLFPASGDGVGSLPVTVYPLEDAVAAVPSAGDITPVISTIVQANYQVKINNILSEAFTVEVGDLAADIIAKIETAVNAITGIPMIATDGTTVLDLESKWAGASANDCYIEMVGPTDKGVTWTLTQPVSGATNPTVDSALAQIGNVWETMAINCLEPADSVALTKFAEVNEGRWGPLVNSPFIAFTANNTPTLATATAISDVRTEDRTNVQLTSPGSHDLPCMIAARQVARIAPVANNNPPNDYAGQQATGLTPGTDAEQWDYPQKDTAVKAGTSTVDVEGGLVTLSDTVTMYHPTGDTEPAYRYVVDIMKIWQATFNTRLIFAQPGWNGAPMIPDDQATVNPTAKKPKMAVSAISNMLTNLGLEAIISDVPFAQSTVKAAISSSNSKRLDSTYTMKISGNSNIISVDQYFGHYYGDPVVLG